MLIIPWTMLMTTEQVYTMAGAESELLDHIKSRKHRYFGHVMRLPHDNIERSSVMTGLVEGIRGRGRPRVCWLDNIVAWTGLSGAACCTLHVTDVAGRQLLIYAANRRSAATAL